MHLPSDAAAPAAPTGRPDGPHSSDRPQGSAHPHGSDRPHGSGATGGRKLDGGILGVGDIVFFVVAAAAPLTVMAGVAPFAIAFGGIGAPVAYLATGLVLALFAVGFTAMTAHVKNAGAFYAYVTLGLGRPAGLGAALLAVFSYNAIQIGMFGAFGYFARTTANDLLGVDLPWPVWALVGVAVVWLLGYRSINLGAKVLGALLIAETGILLVLACAVLARGGAHGLSLAGLAPGNVLQGGMGGVLGLSFAAFVGFEATAIYREEARDPQRTVPRATYLAIAFLGLFYTFITWMIIQAFGDGEAVQAATADPSGMFFTAMTHYVGGWATDLQRVLIVTSLLAALLAFHNTITRYGYALASEGAAPAALGRVHPRHGSPWIGGIAQSVLAAAAVLVARAVGADPYNQFFLRVNSPGVVGILLLQAVAGLAVFAFFRKNPGPASAGRLRTVVAPLASTVLLCGATVLVCWKLDLFTGAGPEVNRPLIAIVPVVFLTGVFLALRLRARRPEVYARLGTTGADAADRPA
ncbi:amino acid permease [Kitasatospora indigofera]|uniref:Amino acid permease n=1 Tax=Kitasatospora indigofera TaxID=67307 RepID=A0A919FK45_9ACTN|nr:APC family permease [Kitasatospora indigofera]GHH67397.1 amino acid permease [Kitasatospora indigofera]